MLRKAFVIIEELFWTMVWVFLVLIIGFAILGFLQNRFGSNPIGSLAGWVASRAQPSAA